MSVTINYIDDYFNGLLSPGEKKDFEQRCEKEESFAQEVAAYVASRAAIRNELMEQKRSAWKDLPVSSAPGETTSPAKVFKMKPWYMIAAAASIIGIIFLVIPATKDKPEALASNYIKQNLQTLGITMDGSKDSLQLGIDLYNKRDYKSALSIFTVLYERDNQFTDALKYKGLANVMDENYPEALKAFDELAAKENLFSNPGIFYKALTLLQRNTNDDKEIAKTLLQVVVDKNLEGSKEAALWLKSW